MRFAEQGTEEVQERHQMQQLATQRIWASRMLCHHKFVQTKLYMAVSKQDEEVELTLPLVSCQQL